MKKDYTDILQASRPVSCHPKMPLSKRAKIFAPFDALRGFNLAVMAKEQEQKLVTRTENSDDAQAELQRTLAEVQQGDELAVRYFQPERTIGDLQLGTYLDLTGTLERIDSFHKTLTLDGKLVPINEILELTRLSAVAMEYADDAFDTIV